MRVPIVVAAGVVALLVGAGLIWLSRPAGDPARSSAAGRDRDVSAPEAKRPGGPDAGLPPSTSPVPRNPPAGRTAAPAAEPAAPATEAAPTTATLEVESDVPGATVFIDRVSVGVTPLTIPNLEPGSHRLNVAAPGYDAYGETIELAAGPRTVRVAFKEIKLAATVPADHKHGVGSCRGELTASPEGLRYAAADGKDNFTATLTDLEIFEIDYLAKNLRVKTRQGRTYNFTTSDPTADALMRFHADVDKARKRLIAER